MRTSIGGKFFLIHFVFSLQILWMGTSCQSDFQSSEKSANDYNVDNYANDSLDSFIWNNFDLAPDSVELILLNRASSLNPEVYPQRLMNTYLHLIEIYQYRKPNQDQAVLYLGKAVKILTDYPVYFLNNPYLFIDIGNLFVQLKLFEQAASFYNISKNIALKTKNEHCTTLALQNIGITFRHRNCSDSALFYLHEARKNVTDTVDVVWVQNNNHIADIYIKLGNYTNAKILLFNNLKILDQEKSMNLGDYKTEGNRYNVIWNETMAITHKNLCCYYYYIGFYDSAFHHLEQAIYWTQKAGALKPMSELLVVKATYFNEKLSMAQLIQQTDSALIYVLKINDLSTIKTFSDSMAAVFHRRNNDEMKDKYRIIAAQISDSMTKLRGSKEYLESVLLMSNLATEELIHNQQNQEKAKNATIVLQKRIIWFAVILVIAISLALVVLQIQRGRLNRAYLAVVKQIQQNTPKDEHHETEKKKVAGDMAEKIELELKNILINEKLFLEKDINLQKLAAALNTNRTYLSAHINSYHQKSFSDYINKLRVEESCRILMYSNQQNYTIDAIADMCGFKSKSVFYIAFKKETGISPTTFHKLHSSAPSTISKDEEF